MAILIVEQSPTEPQTILTDEQYVSQMELLAERLMPGARACSEQEYAISLRTFITILKRLSGIGLHYLLDDLDRETEEALLDAGCTLEPVGPCIDIPWKGGIHLTIPGEKITGSAHASKSMELVELHTGYVIAAGIKFPEEPYAYTSAWIERKPRQKKGKHKGKHKR